MDRVAWDYYDSEGFKKVDATYLPDDGEGNTIATQITTAISKLVYKWYNDGDVYDNTGAMKGWLNDLSSYANWLANYVDGAEEILDRIFLIKSSDDVREMDAQYENILKDLCDSFQTMEYLEQWKDEPKQGTIYDCSGPYRFDESNGDDDWEDDEEEEEEDY